MSYDYKEIVPYLLHWYDYNARVLAWRENPKPYYIWISEIMLQQTRVEAVKGYFDRFITELPDIESLAKEEEEKLLKLWEGLGYYSRVRNLQKAAKLIMTEYNGELPADYDKLLTLPGIGSYTAGAIASIAYGLSVPVVDGNVLRVAMRIAASFEDITKDRVKKELWLALKNIIPVERPGDFNQALMELGAIVCLPNGKPLCEQCPLMHLCGAFREKLIAQIPVKPAKKVRRVEDRTILLIEYQNKYMLRKRPSTGLLAQLWEFPGLDGAISKEELAQFLKDQGILPDTIEPLGNAKHIFSHVEWHMLGYHIILKAEPDQGKASGLMGCWADRLQIKETYSIPNAFSKYTPHIMGN